MKTITRQQITEAVARLCIQANTSLPADVAAALAKAGALKATGVLAFTGEETSPAWNKLARTGRVIRPFAGGLWPGDEMTLGSTRVRLEWGRHRTRTGRLWANAGYSGTEKDDVSYCFMQGDTEVCIGAQARFAQTAGKIIPQQRNRTVRLKI